MAFFVVVYTKTTKSELNVERVCIRSMGAYAIFVVVPIQTNRLVTLVAAGLDGLHVLFSFVIILVPSCCL